MLRYRGVSLPLIVAAFLFLPLLTASSCPRRPPIGTCLQPGPTTVCPTACKRLENCHSCCAYKWGQRAPGNAGRDRCDTSCEKKFLVYPKAPLPWVLAAPDPGPAGIHQPAIPSASLPTVRPVGTHTNATTDNLPCERTGVFRDIFAHVPSFFDTQDMRAFVCWLDEDDRARLLEDILLHQGDVDQLTADDYASLMEWVNTNTQDLLDMLNTYGELDGDPNDVFPAYRNLFLDQLWFDYRQGAYDEWIME